MNAITRVYSTGAVRVPVRTGQRLAWSWGTKFLIALLIISAFSVVYLKDLNRRTFIRYQDMAHANQQARVDWGKLLLEQSTWAAQANIHQTAEQRLHMYTPDAKDIVLVTSL
jgi:cell division protein FtsL